MHRRIRSIPTMLQLTTVVAMLAGFVAAIPAVSMAVPTCDGRAATITGTADADVIEGTPEDDVIVAYGGNDVINGYAGNDVICANGGKDRVRGGPGRDLIFGGTGDDVLFGQGWKDIIYGNAGDDQIYGGKGPDVLRGGDGLDALYGSYHADKLYGGPHADVLWGGAATDLAKGGAGTDDCKAETEAECERNPHDFSIERFYVNQSVPAADSAQGATQRVPAIKGRSGLFRVFVQGSYALAGASPEVVLHWRAGGTGGEIVLDGPGTVPTNPSEGNLSKTFNASFDEGFLGNGMDVYIEVDPSNEFRENSEGNNRWPASGWYDLDVTAMPTFDVTFVPITLNGTTASLSPSGATALLDETLRLHPIAGYTVEIRDPYAFNGSTSNDWVDLLYELADLQAADGSDRTYYGVLPGPISPGIGGIGFIGYPVAHGLADDHIVAHELGHTLSLNHAPCGGAAGTDPEYPYADASIGRWGYDVVASRLVDPTGHKDVMSYCGPSWISDYHYQNIVDYRATFGFAAYAAPSVGQTVLSFGGLIDGAPAAAGPGLASSLYAEDRARSAQIRFAGTAEFVSRAAPGAYRLIGRDGVGRVLFSSSFEAYAYADGPGGDERMFMTQVAVDNAAADALATVEIVHQGAVLDTHRMMRGE
jgi:hypothetical protein